MSGDKCVHSWHKQWSDMLESYVYYCSLCGAGTMHLAGEMKETPIPTIDVESGEQPTVTYMTDLVGIIDMDEMIEKQARELRGWYLEAVANLTSKDYNKDAAIPYDQLSDAQKGIDRYIAKKILEKELHRI